MITEQATTREAAVRPAAIVTGVSRGLGEALAATLLARGFIVLGVGRTVGPALRSAGLRFARCELGEPAAIAATVTPGGPTAIPTVNLGLNPAAPTVAATSVPATATTSPTQELSPVPAK